jgi:hypothetical protein
MSKYTELSHCMLLFFGTYGKWSGHVYAVNGERQMNGEGQISHCNNREVPCLQVHYELQNYESFHCKLYIQ